MALVAKHRVNFQLGCRIAASSIELFPSDKMPSAKNTPKPDGRHDPCKTVEASQQGHALAAATEYFAAAHVGATFILSAKFGSDNSARMPATFFGSSNRFRSWVGLFAAEFAISAATQFGFAAYCPKATISPFSLLLLHMGGLFYSPLLRTNKMGLVSKFAAVIRPTPTPIHDTGPAAAMSLAEESKTPQGADGALAASDKDEPQAELPSDDAQHGVQQVEALTLAWSKGALIAVFAKYAAFRLVALVIGPG